MTDESESTLEVERDPTPAAEAEDFQNVDERIQRQRNEHELAVLDRHQGLIGAWIGSSDSGLSIAFIIIIISGAALISSVIGAFFNAAFFDMAERISTIMLTVAGYVFGVKTSK